MTTVTVHSSSSSATNPAPEAETPSRGILRAAAGSLTVTDDLGRVIVFRRRLTVLQELDLARAAGQEADNTRYMGYATLAATVVSIDGEPFGFPQNGLQIRRIIATLGDDGVNAIVRANNQARAAEEGAEEDTAAAFRTQVKNG